MIKLAILLAVSLLVGCATKPHPRDPLWYTAAGLTVADGWSTSYAMKNPNAREVGWLASRTIGERPSNAQLVGFTAFGLGLLEWSRYWRPSTRKTYQWGIVLTRPYVISVNYRIGANHAN